MLLYEGKNLLKDVVQYVNQYYLIDTHELGNKYETTIYPCDKGGNITDGKEVYVSVYDTETDALTNHYDILKNYKSILKEYTGRTEYKDPYADDDYDDEEEDDNDEEVRDPSDSIQENMKREISRSEESIIIQGGDKAIHVCELFWEDKLGRRVLTVFGGEYGSDANFSFVNTNEEMKKADDETAFKAYKEQVPIIINNNIDKLIGSGWDRFLEFKRIPDFENYCMLYEGKLGNSIRTAALGAALCGMVACGGNNEDVPSSTSYDSTRTEQTDSLRNNGEIRDIDTVRTPEDRGNDWESEHKKIGEWINQMADSVYNKDNNKVSTFMNFKDMFEKFIEDKFKTSSSLKKGKENEAIEVPSFVGRGNRYVYVPTNCGLEWLKHEYELYVDKYGTPGKRRREKLQQYSDNRMYYENPTLDGKKYKADYNQDLPGKYGETYKKHQ